MRVLCTVTGSPSHTRSLVPIARALAARGHELLVVAPPELAPLFDEEPVRAQGVLVGVFEGLRRELAANPAQDLMTALLRLAITSIPVAEARRALPIAADFRPDLILRDDAELGAVLVAEQLGIPHVTLPGGFVNVADPKMVWTALVEHAAVELPAVALPEDGLFRHGRLDYVPGEYSFTAVDAPPARAYRQPVLVRPGERIPDWVKTLRADRPLVLAAMGTALTAPLRMGDREFVLDPTQRLRTMIAALAEVNCTALVVTSKLDVSDVPVPPNVHLTRHLPQPLILETADLFLNHGGYNGIREALRAGVPMVVWPGAADQPSNAVRTRELGLGLQIENGAAEEIHSACARVLAEPGFAVRAEHAKASMLTLPELDQAVTDLEELAAG